MITCFPKKLLCLIASALLALPCFSAESDQPEQPDIIIMLADDMGYSDIGCYGGEIQTPTLDALAEHGVRFTQFYNTGRCCPTRASLLTGLYPHQAGIGHMVEDKGQPGYRGRLSEQSVTIAEVLRTAGYHTAVAGKWHVTPFDYNTEKASHRETWPLQRGFDRFVGSLTGGGNYFNPKSWMNDNEFVAPGEDFYYTDAVGDATVEFINQTPKDKPLFAYVAFTAPHWPLHAHQADITKYDGVYDKGWDAIRTARDQRMREMGLVDAKWKLSNRDARVKAWDDDTEHRDWRAQQMQVYAAMVDRMDQSIARIVEAVKQRGRLDNTIIIFLSDNGGCEELVQMPRIKRFAKPGEDTSRWGNLPSVAPGGLGTFQSYGIGWANASNTPYRWYKSEVHEGGIATPLIVHWPKGTGDALRGKLVHTPGHVIDLMATCVEIGNAEYPQTVGQHTIKPMEGVSLRSALTSGVLERDAPLFFEHQGCAAIRDGQWKLVRLRGKPWELYDLEADRTETTNLASEHPDRVQQMAEEWQVWAKRADVVPRP